MSKSPPAAKPQQPVQQPRPIPPLSVEALQLELPCEKCKETPGFYHNKFTMVPCDKCDGVGYIPTKFGNRVLFFLRRHLKVEQLT